VVLVGVKVVPEMAVSVTVDVGEIVADGGRVKVGSGIWVGTGPSVSEAWGSHSAIHWEAVMILYINLCYPFLMCFWSQNLSS
jgi:hypothetical protein